MFRRLSFRKFSLRIAATFFLISIICCGAAPDARAQAQFVRGDCNADAQPGGELTDAVYLLGYLFLGDEQPPCLEACNVDDRGGIRGQVTDAVYLLSYSFLGGSAPPAPFPDCGVDPTPDAVEDCRSFTPCPQPQNQPPTAGFHFLPLTGVAPVQVRFDAWPSEDLDGRITSYRWDFGDGATRTGGRVGHVYSEPSTYDVTLTVTDDDGATTTAVRTLTVTEEPAYDARFAPLVEMVGEELRALGAPGAAVAVIEGGEVTFAAGFGSRHPNRIHAVEPTTLFRIGSVTKMITTVGLLELVEAGQVDLSAPVTDYLPDFSFSRDATWAPSITVNHLLTHTSAIADYLEIDGSSADSALAGYLNGPYGDIPWAYLMAPPGRMFNYTNLGFMLAGLVTETVSETYYREYLETRVLAPLGMNRTYFLPQRVLEDGDYAHGDSLGLYGGIPRLVAPETYDNAWARPAGYAFSSVLDLAEFVKFLRSGNPAVLGDDLRQAMQEPQMDTEYLLDLYHYGNGLFIQEGGFYDVESSDFYRLRLVEHGGDIPGYSANLFYVPELEFGFVALTNASIAHLAQSFSVALMTLNEMPPPVAPPDLSMTLDDYDKFAGDYLDRYNVGDVRVTREGSRLRVSLPDVTVPYERYLIPYSPRNFILVIQNFGLLLTFILDAEGEAEYFRTRSFVARRVEGEGAALDAPSLPLLRVPMPLPMLPEPRPTFIRPPAR